MANIVFAPLNIGGAGGIAGPLDDNAQLPSEQLPDEIDARIQVLSGTDAALATELLALGELAAPTDGAWIRKGDGVTPGGALVGRPDPSFAFDYAYRRDEATAGDNLGGSGTPGSIGSLLRPQLRIERGSGGDNSTSGTGNGGNPGTILAGVNPLAVIGGSGGNASGNFSGGNGGNLTTSSANLGYVRIVTGNGGNAGTGGNGGNGGGGGTTVVPISIRGGNGGNGGTGSAGGTGGAMRTALSSNGGNGGNGGASGETGGAGGLGGFLSFNGGNGATGAGGVAGGNGGAAGSINLSGANASGTTAGMDGGSIDLSAGQNILTIRGTAGQFGHRVAVPANSAAAGLVGQWASDDNYIYFYGATGWRRVAGATF